MLSAFTNLRWTRTNCCHHRLIRCCYYAAIQTSSSKNASRAAVVRRSLLSTTTTTTVQQQKYYNGTVKWFDVKKGYGFISPEDGSPDIFVYQTAIHSAEGFRSLLKGESVEFTLTKTDPNNPDRKSQAERVTGPGGSYVRGKPKKESKHSAFGDNGSSDGGDSRFGYHRGSGGFDDLELSNDGGFGNDGGDDDAFAPPSLVDDRVEEEEGLGSIDSDSDEDEEKKKDDETK